ncbi:energy-coupling factor transporter ATP-binding protein EcfA2 [Bradyrhizobium sp. LM2.7]
MKATPGSRCSIGCCLRSLGWKHDPVLTEPHTNSGYIDYLLTIGERRGAMVIEAKRVDKLAPATKSSELMHVALNGPVVRPLSAGIKQAMVYAMEKGVAVAAVTDGNTWFFFKASRTDGKPPLEGKGVLFPTLDTVFANFAKFAELLGPVPVVERRHLANLNEAEGLTVSDAEQQFFVLNPSDAEMRNRDPLASDAALLFSQFFSRLSDEQDREMLRDCFVETSESRKADFELEKIIQRVLNNISPLNTSEGSSALQAELERTMISRRSETVLLIGNKGAGKSTFIDRFFEQVLPRSLREKCVVARVDLQDYHGDPKGIVNWVILQLREKLEAGVCSSNPPTYDELQGMFFSEYQRWSVGSRKHLYETNKIEFKNRFGLHLEERREKNPDEYVRRLLEWASRGHSKLPCLIFDNTDQFPIDVQDAVYQMAHSFEGAAPVFNVVPITDRTVWRLSKAGALQSYSAKSFYLPVPDAKEIISRRVDFLKIKLKAEPKAAKAYFSNKGFQVEVNDLAMLAEAVGKVFVENDYVSGLIGRLGNFDIRRMLKLAERIFLSPELKIDDIIKSKFGGPSVTTDEYRTHRALIKGEYDRFSETENEFISNLFFTNPQRPEPPLLAFYILWLLRQRLNAVRDNSVESKHWLVVELCQLFESCGVAEELVMQTIARLYDRRLIEGLDPNVRVISVADKIAVKECGLAHIELMLISPVYIEQMALVTGVNELFARDEMRKKMQAWQMTEVRDTFIRYILKIDAGRMNIPANVAYSQVGKARIQIESLLPRRPRLSTVKTV